MKKCKNDLCMNKLTANQFRNLDARKNLAVNRSTIRTSPKIRGLIQEAALQSVWEKHLAKRIVRVMAARTMSIQGKSRLRTLAEIIWRERNGRVRGFVSICGHTFNSLTQLEAVLGVGR